MIFQPIFLLILMYSTCARCILPTDLVCPNSGSEIVIDGIGMESQKFRFPAVGTFGFPEDFECKWIFKAQPGLRLLLQSRDATIDENERIQVLDTNDDVLEDEPGALTDRDSNIVTSTGDSLTVRLTTDGNTGSTEELFINVIAGTDSGNCPGTTTLFATDTPQFLTTNNFPSKYGSNEECDVTILAEEGKVVNYTFEFTNMEEFVPARRRIGCFDTIEVFDGSSTDNTLFDSCDPFFPQNFGLSSGQSLRVRYETGSIKEEFGFLLRYKQEDVDECAALPGPCSDNAICMNTDGSFLCECRPGFTGNGFQCEAATPVIRKFIIPFLASSVGAGLTGAGLLFTLYVLANAGETPYNVKW
ncbi:tolloid-like protein 2 isoform X3 [Crassostrea angulata]|nr:tolloid-like protein 2 isoform X3 [Crassostrea angulata]XP_052710738.1 tolloid-like protein 2 isoform X3 [Crassostrea angulata]